MTQYFPSFSETLNYHAQKGMVYQNSTKGMWNPNIILVPSHTELNPWNYNPFPKWI